MRSAFTVSVRRTQTGRYSRWRAFAASRLANLLFTYELDRRVRAEGLPLRALAADPGLTSTHQAAAEPVPLRGAASSPSRPR